MLVREVNELGGSFAKRKREIPALVSCATCFALLACFALLGTVWRLQRSCDETVRERCFGGIHVLLCLGDRT